MNNIPVTDARSFAIIGHSGSGKTSLVDALLFKLGQNDRLGSVTAGSSMADYTDEEKARKITIYAKPFNGTYKPKSGPALNLTFLDTPGYMDFFGHILSAAHAVESALITVDASAGVQVGTRHAWKCCDKTGLSRAFVVTGLDKDNTHFSTTVQAIRTAFGNKCVPVQMMTPDQTGVLDILNAAAIPDAAAAEAEEARNGLMELAAETDDTLIEKFLEGHTLSPDELALGLKKAVRGNALVPIFICLPIKNIGIPELMDGIGRFLPSPADVPVQDAEGNAVQVGADQPFVGFAWRSVNDPFVGQLTFVRVVAGTLQSDSEVFNPTRKQKERIGTLISLNGRKQESIAQATAGDVVAIAKLKVTVVNDTLCAMGKNVMLKPIVFPRPVTFMAVTAKTQADEDKIGTALARVADEDPTLCVQRNTETRQLVLSGLGDVHIDVAVDRMKRRSNVDVVLDTPKVPYRETVTTMGEGHYKHKKQSGGRGQFGEVYLRAEPKRADEEEWFVNAIVGRVIPGNFIPAIEKGVVEGMQAGAVAGYPVANVKVSVFDGSYHEVDSSEISFKIAGSRAFREAMANAKPVLLEPIMTVKISVPDQFLGDINGDLNHRRGRILGMGIEDGMQTITADVPQAEMFRYGAELRSMTGGQGFFEMDFSRYEIVPSNVAQKVVAATRKDKEEEEE